MKCKGINNNHTPCRNNTVNGDFCGKHVKKYALRLTYTSYKKFIVPVCLIHQLFISDIATFISQLYIKNFEINSVQYSTQDKIVYYVSKNKVLSRPLKRL